MVSSCVYFLYYMNTKDKDFKVIDDTHVNIKKNFANYTLPTKKNPFMNLNVLDYGTNKVVKPALRGIKVQNKISKYFDKMYKNANDLNDKDGFLRQYYTMPVTTIPNNAIKFAKWCYRKKGTCKKEKYCYNNIYSPLNRNLSIPNK